MVLQQVIVHVISAAILSSREEFELADTENLIKSEDTGTETDGPAVSLRETSKRTRHRPSAKK